MCTLRFEKLLNVALVLTQGSTFELPRETERRIARFPGVEARLAPRLLELPGSHVMRQNLRTTPVQEPM